MNTRQSEPTLGSCQCIRLADFHGELHEAPPQSDNLVGHPTVTPSVKDVGGQVARQYAPCRDMTVLPSYALPPSVAPTSAFNIAQRLAS